MCAGVWVWDGCGGGNESEGWVIDGRWEGGLARLVQAVGHHQRLLRRQRRRLGRLLLLIALAARRAGCVGRGCCAAKPACVGAGVWGCTSSESRIEPLCLPVVLPSPRPQPRMRTHTRRRATPTRHVSNSSAEPNRSGIRKLSSAHSSDSLFCSGVPGGVWGEGRADGSSRAPLVPAIMHGAPVPSSSSIDAARMRPHPP